MFAASCLWQCVGVYLVCATMLVAQQVGDPDRVTEPTLRDFNPKPALRVAKTDLKHAKFPVIDVHTHFGLRLRGETEALADYVRVMDRNNISISVSLDAKLGCEEDHLLQIGNYKDRMAAFASLISSARATAKIPKPGRPANLVLSEPVLNNCTQPSERAFLVSNFLNHSG